MIQNQLPPSTKEPLLAEDPLLAELSAYLAEPGPWTARFNRLATDLDNLLTCEACQELLDVYVEDEQAGETVRQIYPVVWQHLQTCSDCEMMYQLLTEMLQPEDVTQPEEEKEEEYPPIPSDVPWISHIKDQIRGFFRVQFQLNPSYLQTLLFPMSFAQGLRSVTSTQPAPHMLLYDTVFVGEHILTVEVTGTRQEEETLALQAMVYSDPLPANLRALLTWGDKTHSAPVDDQGQADLGEVPLASLHADTRRFAFELVSAVGGEKEG